MERHIFLVGMPGSGKSALGRRVAQKLQIPYLDTDVYLTEATGMNTAQLYTTFGEQAFRDGETRLLQQLVNATPGIISTGGGVCLREENRRLMRNHGLIVLIDRPIDAAGRRYIGEIFHTQKSVPPLRCRLLKISGIHNVIIFARHSAASLYCLRWFGLREATIALSSRP